MKIISFITEPSVIHQILEHLGLWQMKPTRDPPVRCALPEVAFEPYDDGWPGYEESYAKGALCAFSRRRRRIGTVPGANVDGDDTKSLMSSART